MIAYKIYSFAFFKILSRIFSCSVLYTICRYLLFFFFFPVICHLSSSSLYSHFPAMSTFEAACLRITNRPEHNAGMTPQTPRSDPYLSESIGACTLHQAIINFCLGWIAYLYVRVFPLSNTLFLGSGICNALAWEIWRFLFFLNFSVSVYT